MVAFYDNNDPNGTNFYKKYGNKYITITGTCNNITTTFQAIIADTCGNSDCNNCCAKNSDPTTGFLIDMEYYTVMRNFGTTACADVVHKLQFSVDVTQPPVYANCGAGFGGCGDTTQCCSADGYCGTDVNYCGVGCQKDYGPCN